METERKKSKKRKQIERSLYLIYGAPMAVLLTPMEFLKIFMMFGFATVGVYMFVKTYMKDGVTIKSMLRTRYAVIWFVAAMLFIIYMNLLTELFLYLCDEY